MIGTVVGGYEITEFLAEGGMGAVWAAKHTVMGRAAVVKLLHAEMGRDESIVQRFINEARAAASINDPGIVQVFDVGHLPDGRAYLVMERLDGQTLAARLAKRGDAPMATRVDEAINVLRLIVRTLIAAHGRGIVHRDLKPENIFLVPDPDVAGGERTKILDFGIAKLATGPGSNATRAGSMFGTPAYMAPEQCSDSASVDARADLYAVGCIAYEMLAGQPPFGSGNLAVIAAQLRDEPRPLREHDARIPVGLASIVARLLQKDPDARYASASELYAALEHVNASTLPARPVEREASATGRESSRRRPLGLAVAVVVVGAAVAVGVVMSVGRGGEQIAAGPGQSGAGSAAGAATGAATASASGSATESGSATASASGSATESGSATASASGSATESGLASASAPESASGAATATATGAASESASGSATAPAPASMTGSGAGTPARPTTGRRPTTKVPKTETTTKGAPRETTETTKVAPPTEPTKDAPTEPTKVAPTETKVAPTEPTVAPKRVVRRVEAGPIGGDASAKKKCPTVCAPGTWTGAWRTTIKGKMSTCDCEQPP